MRTPAIFLCILSLHLLFAPGNSCAQRLETTGYPDLDLFYDRVEANVHDDIISRKREIMRTIPLEEVVRNYAEKGFINVFQDLIWLDDYFWNVVSEYPEDEYEGILERMRQIAAQYKSPTLDAELEFLRGYIMKVTDEETYSRSIKILENVARQARRKKDKHMELRALGEMWHNCLFSGLLTEYFYYAGLLSKGLEEVDNSYPYKYRDYFRLGMCYYLTNEYEKALPYLRKALHNEPTYFQDETNIQARNYLASYYSRVEVNLDSAEYYQRAILQLDESVEKQPPQLGIAITNLGRIAMKRGEWDKAIAMLEAGKKLMLGYTAGEAAFVGGIYVSLGISYLETGRVDKLPGIIDSARMYMESHWIKDLGKNDLFDLMARYHARIGNGELSSAYLDSMHVHIKKSDMTRSSNMMARGEQRLHDMEKQLLDEKIEKQRHTIFLVSLLLMISITAAVVVIRLYRKKRDAHRVLAEKARYWADGNTAQAETDSGRDDNPDSVESQLSSAALPSKEDENVIAILDGIMNEKKVYADPSLTLEKLADIANIQRHLLSRAINRTTGKNFSQYINEYRVKEAIRVMSSPARNGIYIDELYERVGFNSRTSFYRVFKQITGLSPSDFRKSRK